MTLEEEKRLAAGWRGRRLLACRASDVLERVIENLGKDNGEDCPPAGGLPPVSEGHRRELGNAVALVLRMILGANDGHVSTSKLQMF